MLTLSGKMLKRLRAVTPYSSLHGDNIAEALNRHVVTGI
jgi:hypothetical protein